jgi:hypothetical protein
VGGGGVTGEREAEQRLHESGKAADADSVCGLSSAGQQRASTAAGLAPGH